MKKSLWLTVFILTLLFCICADASTLVLPASLTLIEEEAFMGDTSLDEVVLGNKIQRIESRAFAESSVKSVILPDSIYYIADNAFEGVDDLIINAEEGTYAYTWAVQNEYIKIDEVPVGGETKVIMPSTLRAGADLDIQVFGPANTVSHTVILVNNATNEGLTRYIHEQNGYVKWDGHELENGTYTVNVYTVTKNYGVLAPISKTLVINGTKPASPENIETPEKLGWSTYEIPINSDDYLAIKQSYYDPDGKKIESHVHYSDEQSIYIFGGGIDGSTYMTVSFSSREDGLWSEWSPEKTIELVDGYYDPNRPQLKNLFIPDNIVAGADFEISFECEEGISSHRMTLVNEYGEEIISIWNESNQLGKIIVPGFAIDAGLYYFDIQVYDGYDWYTVVEQTINIHEGRKPANVILTADKSSAYTNEDVELSITSNGADGAYIKIVGDGINYIGCNLQEDGSGTCSTRLTVLNSDTKTTPVSLSACVLTGDGWSEWSDPIIIVVTRPDPPPPLPVPIIAMKDKFETGEDINISIDDIDQADYYSLVLRENYSNEIAIEQYYYNYQSNFGEDVVLSGTQFGSGTYTVDVHAYSNNRGSSHVSKTIKVSGTRAPAPSVVCDPDEFRINRTTTFTIDTQDCENVYISYNGYKTGYSWGDSFTIEPTGNTTSWNYKFSSDSEDASFTFTFVTKKDGKWTYSKEIKKTVLGLPPLDPAVIHVNDTIEAGTDLTIMFDPVENATSYEFRLYTPDGSYLGGGGYSPLETIRYNGYALDPGNYIAKVWAFSDDYTTSISEKAFTIVGSKASAPEVSVDKTEVYKDEPFTFTINTSGSTLLYETDQWGNRNFINVYDDTTQWTISHWDNGEMVYRFALLKDGKWTELSEPITITVRERPSLSQPVIQAVEMIDAGNDLAFSFTPVENATHYSASFSSVYGGGALYEWRSETALPDTELIVPGYLINAGNYVLNVTAYADGYTSSKKLFYVTASGARPSGPIVTVDEPIRIKSNTVFAVDTEDAEALQVRYVYTAPNNWWPEEQYSVPVTGNTTEWSLTIDEYKEGVNLTVSFSAKKGGVWSSWRTNTYTIAGLPPLDPAVIHVDDTIEAGHDFIVTVDPVANATLYDYWLYMPSGDYQWSNSENIGDHRYYGYKYDPGEYRVVVNAYSNDYTTSTGEKIFTITGTKPDAPIVSVNKSDVQTSERFLFTIDTANADALRYKVNNDYVYSINILEDETQWLTYHSYAGTYDYRFAVRRNGVWTDWTESITVNVTGTVYGPLDSPEITINPMESKKDLTVTISEVENATYYEVSLNKTDETISFIRYLESGKELSANFPGYRLEPGTYQIRARAYNSNTSSDYVYETITLSATEQIVAPAVTPPENTQVAYNSSFSFGIDTTGADMIAVRSFTVGYTNDITYDIRNVSEGQNETTWTFYNSGSNRKYSFAVRKNGVWSGWSGFITISTLDNE